MQDDGLVQPEQARPMTVAVVGLGKIGLPLAVQYAQHGYRVLGCDSNERVVAAINAGHSHVQEEAELATAVPRLVKEGLLAATGETARAVQQADVVVVIVPVWVNEQHEIDFSALDAATGSIAQGLRAGTLVIYETTLPVGTTARRLRPLLERGSQLRAGEDFSLAYSPERVSSGHIFRDLRSYPKIVGGIDERSTERAAHFYRSVLECTVMTMASCDEAEFVKLIETTYRDVNIALANEYARYADQHGLNVFDAIAAANTQPYAHIHMPGVGVGGHCIPVYPYFLFANPLDEGYETPFALPLLARQTNDVMAEYTVQRVERAIGSLDTLPVLILGVAYRGNVRETAFSSAKLLQKALLRRGAQVYAHDPLFSDNELRQLGYVPLPLGLESAVYAIILQGNHHEYETFDFHRFTRCKVVMDGRHALNKAVIEASGMRYLAVGDGSPL